jgi:peptide/nickel transport system substrate-binding protein
MATRRAFLRQGLMMAGGGAMASLLAACGQPAAPPPAPAAKPTEAPAQGAPKPAAPTVAPTSAPQPAAAAPTSAPQTAPAAAKPGGALVVALEADPLGFDPAFFSVPGRRAARAIYDPLLELDEQGNIQPGLAERWEQPDDTTYLFHIRPGVKFHDGTALDAEAVKFHFDRHMDPETGSFRKTELGTLDRVDVTGPLTVKATLKSPYAPFPYALFDWVGFVISPAAYQRWGKQDYRFHPAGTGPFRFVSYAKDQQTVVERNPDYWRTGEPLLESVTFRAIPLDSTRLTELRSGGAHIAEDMPFQDFQRLKSMSEIAVSEKGGFRWDSVFMNVRKDPYTNKKLRQALNWALDREAIQKSVYFDTGQIGYDPFLPGTPYFDPGYKPFTRDVDRAKRLLEESGLPTPLQVTVTLDQDQANQKIMQIVQANLAELGVNVEIKVEDAASRLENVRAGNTQMSTTWFGYRPDPDGWIYSYFHSKGSNNYYGFYSSPEADDLIERARGGRDQAQRVALYRQLADRLNDDAPNVFFHYGSNIKGLSPRVKGFVHFQDSMIRFQKISLE